MENAGKMKRKGQVVLDTALALVAVAIFLVGIVRIWAWFGRTLKDRWASYDSSRYIAGRIDTYKNGGFVPDGYVKQDLNLFQ
jgi:hypothetical protein